MKSTTVSEAQLTRRLHQPEHGLRQPLYQEWLPHPDLQDRIVCYWTLDFPPHRSQEPVPFRILPDGCADLIFDIQSGENLLVGCAQNAFLSPSRPGDQHIGIRFRPGGMKALLELAPKELSNGPAQLADLGNRTPYPFQQFIQQAHRQPDIQPSVRHLEQILLKKQTRQAIDPLVDACSRLIAHQGGIGEIAGVARQLGYSPRALELKFRDWVGLTPKTFARIVRVRRVIHQLRQDQKSPFIHIALDHGFYDQAHFNREIKKLTGLTPDQIRTPPEMTVLQAGP